MQPVMTKDEWVELFREAGIGPETMVRWHALFEQRHGTGHQAFLEWLGIPTEEIAVIRTRSRT